MLRTPSIRAIAMVVILQANFARYSTRQAARHTRCPPSPGGGGRGGLRPPSLALRTPTRSVGYGAKRAGWGDQTRQQITPPRRLRSLRSLGVDPPPPGEGGHRDCGSSGSADNAEKSARLRLDRD